MRQLAELDTVSDKAKLTKLTEQIPESLPSNLMSNHLRARIPGNGERGTHIYIYNVCIYIYIYIYIYRISVGVNDERHRPNGAAAEGVRPTGGR